ncbi:MAG: PKD domain-containing protein [bacterium]
MRKSGKFYEGKAYFTKWRKATANGVRTKRKSFCSQLILASFILFISTKAVAVNWWDPGYSYRRQIEIKNGAASPLEQDYSVAVVLDTTNGSKFQPDGDDLRVVSWNGSSNTDLDREVININTTATAVWFKTRAPIPVGVTDNNYYLYYGNPGASNPPANLNNVYIFGDDFESGLGQWSYYNGEVSTSSDVAVKGNQSLKINNTRNGIHDQIYINKPFPFTTLRVSYYVRLLQDKGASMAHSFHQGDTLPAPDQAYRHSSTISWSHLDNDDKMEYYNGSWHTFYNDLSPNRWYQLDEYFDFNSRKMMINVDGGNFEVNDNTGLISQPTQAVKYLRFWTYDGEPGRFYIDEIRLRKYAEPEPLALLQAEEGGIINQLPVANAGGPYSGWEGSSVILNGSASSDPDTDGVIISYEWDVNGDGAYDTITGVTPAYTWNDDYAGTVGLRVTDNKGGQAVAEAPVVIGNVAPVAQAGGPYTGIIASPLTLNGSAADPGSDTLSYAWDLDNDGFYDDSTQQNPSYTWNTPGDKTVWLQVTDDDGGAGTDSAAVTISLPTGTPVRIVLDSPQPAYAEVKISIEVGNASDTIADLFALSFRFNYPRDRISEVISVETSGELLGGDIISHINIDEGVGEIRMSLSRKRGQGGVSGFGKVALLKLRIPADAGGQIITFSLDRLLAVDPSDHPLDVYSLPTSLVVTDFVVWPGDTNNDGRVNEIDILPLGSYWLRSGPPRASASSTWQAQTATPWSPEIGATYADANGDGEVNEKEVIPIGLNWEKTHNGSSPAPTRSKADQMAAYEAMYLFLKDAPPTEPVERIRAFLLSLIDPDGRTEIPLKTSLSQNYPNPINPETWIPFALSEKSQVEIQIYNLAGQLIRTLELGLKEPGSYLTKNEAAYWDGKDDEGKEVSSGIYLYQLRAGLYVSTRKMIILK